MGWTWYRCKERKADGTPDVKTEVDGMLTWGRFSVLKSAMVGSTYYAAVRNGESGDVFAAVVLTSVENGAEYDFGYKDMDEDMGPVQADCPVSILDLLTPTDSEWANEWRGKCRSNAEERAWFGKLADGATVEWVVPTSGYRVFDEGQRVVLVKGPLNPGKRRSKRVWNVSGSPYYLNRDQVKKSDVEVIEDAA